MWPCPQSHESLCLWSHDIVATLLSPIWLFWAGRSCHDVLWTVLLSVTPPAASGNLRCCGLSPLPRTAERPKREAPTLPGHKAITEWKLAAGVRHACAIQEGWDAVPDCNSWYPCAQVPHGVPWPAGARLVLYPNFMLQVPNTDLPHRQPHGPVKGAARPHPRPQEWSPPGNSLWPHPDQLPQPQLHLET